MTAKQFRVKVFALTTREYREIDNLSQIIYSFPPQIFHHLTKDHMRYFLSLIFLTVLLLLGRSSSSSAVTLASELPVGILIKNTFGPNVEVVRAATPIELKGDFNGDGFKDIAVLVSPKGRRSELAPGVNIAQTTEGARSLAPADILNGNNSLAVIHGSASGLQSPKAKYLIYAFGWIGWNGTGTGSLLVLPKAKQKRDKQGYATLSPGNAVSLPQVNKGDVIVVPTEAGINTILYWDGSKYRFWLDPGEAD
jgi:hypothetical protein